MQYPQGTQVSLRTVTEREGAVQRRVCLQRIFLMTEWYFFSKTKFITYLYFILACVAAARIFRFFSGLLSSCGARSSHCSGFPSAARGLSRCNSQALEYRLNSFDTRP